MYWNLNDIKFYKVVNILERSWGLPSFLRVVIANVNWYIPEMEKSFYNKAVKQILMFMIIGLSEFSNYILISSLMVGNNLYYKSQKQIFTILKMVYNIQSVCANRLTIDISVII